MSTALAKIESNQSIQALKMPENMQQFETMLGSRAPHFIASIVGLFASNSQLSECTPESVVIAAVQGAAMDLSFDPNIGEAYMVPYNRNIGDRNRPQWVKIAQYQPGYKGLIQLALRTGEYTKLGCAIVTQKMFTALRSAVESSTNDPAKTTIRFFEMSDFYPEYKTGKPVGYIAYFELKNGFNKFVYWTHQECIDHAKKYSKQQDKNGNLYGSWEDAQDAMCLKTVIRQVLKFGPKSKEMRTSLEADSMDLSSDYDRFDAPSLAIREGHEDDDMFGGDTRYDFGDEDEPEEPVNDITPKQRDLLLKIMQSHVFTDAERESATKFLNHSKSTRQKFDKWLKSAQETAKQRKKNEKEGMSDEQIAAARETIYTVFGPDTLQMESLEAAITDQDWDQVRLLVSDAKEQQ